MYGWVFDPPALQFYFEPRAGLRLRPLRFSVRKMAFKDLREFIETLDRMGELKHIHAPVNQDLEITEITDRVTKQGGPALMFHNVDRPQDSSSDQCTWKQKADAHSAWS